MSVRPVLHIVLHFVMPGVLARLAYPGRWRTAWLVMAATIIVDVDHLLADPIYDPDRCSIGFHPLHTWPAIVVYAVLTLLSRTRMIGLGLLLHMFLDGVDCVWRWV
jgi:hypothetical protein